MGRASRPASILSMGTMRLPLDTARQDGSVDVEAAIALLRHGIDRGINYLDTAYPYHGGESEKIVGSALTDGYRDQVLLATKLPIWAVHSIDDCDRVFDEQLARLRTDHVDVYLVHCLQDHSWQKTKDLGVFAWMEKLRDQDRIGSIGFSFHASFATFVEIVDTHPWDVCQIQYNYVGEEVQAGKRGLRYAASKGLSVVVMEPLFGGELARPRGELGRLWDNAPHEPVDLALRWLWQQPDVATVLSGMSNRQQLDENLALARKPQPLTEDETRFLGRVQKAYRDLSPIACSKCRYCMPCPNGVDIPGNFELYNNAKIFDENPASTNLYSMMSPEQRAAACVACGQCVEACPQELPIVELLKQVDRELSPG